jgi:hypothetical protein
MRKILGIFCAVGLFAFIVPVRADDDAATREIVSRAIKAHGGIEALKKYKGSVSKTKGKFYGIGGGIEYSGDTSVQLPNRLRTELELKVAGQDISIIQVIAGDKGWFKIGNKTEELKGELLAEAKEQISAGNNTHLVCLNDKECKLSPLGEIKVADRAAVGVRVERKGYRDVNLFFDKEKNFLVKMETRGKDPMGGGGEFTATTLYEDYKRIDGIMVAHKVTVKRDDKLFVESTVTDIKLSEKLDDNLFEKP